MRILQILLFPLQGSGSGSYADRLAGFEQARGHTVKVLCCDHGVSRRSYETAALVFKDDGSDRRMEFAPAERFRRSSTCADVEPTVRAGGHGGFSPQARDFESPAPNTDLDFNFPAFTTHPLSTATTFGSLSADQRERYVVAFRRKIQEEVALFKPDIVHAHHGWVISAALADLAVPYVISLHGTEHYGFLHYPAYRELALKGLCQADRVLALTEVERVKAIETYGLDPDRVRVITSGVDTTLFRPHLIDRRQALTRYSISEFDRPMVFAGSKLTAIKGAAVLLHAAAIYARRPERPLTLIAGEGDERPHLEALCAELKLCDEVIFLGHQNAAQMVELYNLANVTVLASRTDWFPLVVIESLACGTPVIASEVGGLSQLVTSNVGRLFSAGDYATLAAHVTDFIRSDFKATAWSVCVEHVREKFGWNTTVERIIAVYQDVLREHAKVTRCA
ncbi:D-inositol 3-phosphate glycosyltransferase [Thermoflexales bacterium]|nr:D-inositol 3-phosphate glycosyltransferase [Thermoflexales bacterium]